jgi:hypothetical protein
VHRTWMKPQAPPLTKLKFIEPMYARLVNELPQGQEWLYEVKFDGYGCLAGRDSTGVTLWSRRAACTNRVHRMDAGGSPEAFEVCRVTRRQKGS